MLVRHERYFKFRPHAIGPAHQHRIFITYCVKLEQGAEGTYVGKHFRPERFFYNRRNKADKAVPLININACFLIGNFFHNSRDAQIN